MQAPDNAKTPEPLYSCADPDCAEQVSHRAEDLHWVADFAVELGWYCDDCIDNMPDRIEGGESLAEFLARRKARSWQLKR